MSIILAIDQGTTGSTAVLLDEKGRSRYGGRPRLANELVWHKMLDLLGDLGPFRARGRLTGRLYAQNPGHDRNPIIIKTALESGTLQWQK